MAKKREGKWERFLEELPRLPAGVDAEKRGNQEYMDRVAKKKEEYAAEPAGSIAASYKEARAEKDALEEAESDVNLKISALAQAVADKYQAEGLKSLALEDGASVGLHYEPYAQIEDKRALLKWVLTDALAGLSVDGERMDDTAVNEIAEHMMRTGFGPILGIPWQTLNGLLKDALESGLEPPPGVKAFMLPKVSLRGA